MNQDQEFDSKIISEIIAANKCGIKGIDFIQNILSVFFTQTEYKAICDLIKVGNVSEIINWNSVIEDGFEFLDVYIITDQDGNNYFVTIYDSKELWQEPQIIEIFASEDRDLPGKLATG